MSDANTPPGWYPDPSNPSQQRYWDGTAWTDASAPAAAPAAPQQAGYGYTQAAGIPYASFGSRFLALLVDVIGLGIVSGILATVLGQDPGSAGASVVSLLVGIPYFVYFEGTTGQTIGKKLLNVQVVGAESLQPGIGYGQAALRYVGHIVSGFLCLLGYFWMLWDDEKQCWHDKIASTKVITVAG